MSMAIQTSKVEHKRRQASYLEIEASLKNANPSTGQTHLTTLPSLQYGKSISTALGNIADSLTNYVHSLLPSPELP